MDDPSHQYIPHLWNEMLPEGVLYTNLLDSNYEFHLPTLNAINTGMTYQSFSGIIKPTIFQYVRKKYKLPKTKLWMINAWVPKFCYLLTNEYPQGTEPGIFMLAPFVYIPAEVKSILTKQELLSLGRYENVVKSKKIEWPHWDTIGRPIFLITKRLIQRYKPVFVHYSAIDIEVAHADPFGRYMLALQNSDQMIYEIWQMIKEDSFYKDNTYLIISPDHERNAYCMNHSDNTPENPSRVWMYVYGPDVKKGAIINRPVNHTDIFATVAYLMNVETHHNEGKILQDCFLDEKHKIK